YSFDAVGSTQPYDRASVDGVGPFHTFSASMGKDAAGREILLPCQRPPWSRLVAVNANTGAIAWQTTLGMNENLPAGKQNVGRDVVPGLGRFSSGTVIGSSCETIAARWSSNHGGRSSVVPSSSGASSLKNPPGTFAVHSTRMPPGERTYIEWK